MILEHGAAEVLKCRPLYKHIVKHIVIIIYPIILSAQCPSKLTPSIFMNLPVIEKWIPQDTLLKPEEPL